ncbi:hypothetical protein C5E45_20695 [Nocardia nova]|uniref:Uncharacterized protein n=1 Tax=Nocardia nova TaxID=37330 RepID=A0A2S6AMP2_9NOCA|nr:hypothetical protein C5E45_20695 [Nocardia nova]
MQFLRDVVDAADFGADRHGSQCLLALLFGDEHLFPLAGSVDLLLQSLHLACGVLFNSIDRLERRGVAAFGLVDSLAPLPFRGAKRIAAFLTCLQLLRYGR